MNVSYKWLNEYTKIDLPPHDLAHMLNMTGTEIKGYTDLAETCKNVVVGKILKIERHPDAEKLVVCQVDVNDGEPLQIVTGASNVKEGDLVPVAKHKSVLPNGMKITKGKLRGVESCGMLCSVGELGITTSDYPGSIEDGILILHHGNPGDDIKDVLGFNDVIFEADIMTNRPDCLSMIGVAREAAATCKAPFHVPTPAVKADGEPIENYLKVNIKDKDLCCRYSARVVTDVKIEPSPLWLIERLRAAGIRAINNIVDITNYVMMEYGQPMHAFDYACIDGHEITVRLAEENEPMTTLDDAERQLTADTLVIADNKKPIAIAGVMGGQNSEIADTTKTVVFESANFFGASIRKTAKRLGMRTEASAHFEKNLDPQLTVPALERACELVELLGAGKVCNGMIDVDYSDKTVKTLPLDTKWLAWYTDTELSDASVKEMLERVGFGVDIAKQEITVPTFRSDIETKYDISEECARFYGYDNIPSKSFSAEIASGGLTPMQQFVDKTGRSMRASGFSEAMTYSFVSPKDWDKIGLPADSALRNAMKILNPLGEDTSVMRTTSLPSMLHTLADNYKNRNAKAWLYEIATVYLKNEDETKLPDERKILTVGAYGDSVDFYALKGAVEQFITDLRLATPAFRPCKTNPSYHPGRTATLELNGTVVGVFGQIHPEIAENFGLDTEVYAAEFDMAALFANTATDAVYKPLPKYPAVTRDLALVCNEDVMAGDLEAIIRKSANSTLESLSVFDVYRGANIAEGYKSIAYALTFRAEDRTMQDKEIDDMIAKILKNLEENGVSLRR